MTTSMLAAFRAAVRTAGQRPMLVYFDAVLTYGDVDRLSDGFAVALSDNGFGRGDRLALYLQNVPQYVIALLAVWKLGGIAVAVNPMLTSREVAKLLADCTPKVLLTLDELHSDALAEVLADSSVQWTITTSASNSPQADTPEDEFACLIMNSESCRPTQRDVAADDVAVITYTSGTTGAPKGAMNTHRNVATGGYAYRDWFDLGSDDVILGVAPLFHVTGLTGHIAAAIAAGASLVLTYRFDVESVIDVIRRRKVTFTVGAITAFIALTNAATARAGDLGTLTKVASGGAPVSPATAEAFQRRFGIYIHNVYGMTETTSPVLAVPLGSKAPVSAETGALSVGVPISGVKIVVLDDHGTPLPAGELGELAVSGPQIVPGYWRNERATDDAIHDGWLRTGDVGYVDGDGWYYLVDRKKDMIIASGYKVWPREVEDVLYTHEAVLEAAVVGRPDPYRGETVMAYVSLREGISVDPSELVEYCRSRMAAYKYPREVAIVDVIPKTASGKILRRSLRE
ncbi:MAG: AMP-binding protein [Mycobacterium sp.]